MKYTKKKKESTVLTIMLKNALVCQHFTAWIFYITNEEVRLLLKKIQNKTGDQKTRAPALFHLATRTRHQWGAACLRGDLSGPVATSLAFAPPP